MMLSDVFYRLRALFRRDLVERELHDELQFHIEQHIDKYVRAGLTRENACRRVRREFGGLDQVTEQCRDARGVGVVDDTMRNLRYAVRTLIKRPAFATVATVTLALGIGANSAVFSAIHAILLSPLPFPDGDRLMRLEQYEPKSVSSSGFVAPPRLDDWQRMNATFEAMTGYYTDDMSETSGALPERLARAWVTPGFLQVWGVPPALGRGFTPDEERFGGPFAVIVSDRLWRRRFGADRQVLGRTVRIGPQSYPIVGVMPPSFQFPIPDVDVWMPSPVGAPYARSRQATWFTVIGRLRPHVTVADAQADLDRVQAQLAAAYPETDARLAVRILALKDVTVGGMSRSLWMLFAAVTVLLLIACANIAALLLARTADRQHEIAIRYSLGASRTSIVRQLLTEALVVAVLGSVAGLGVAAVALRAFRVLAGSLPRMTELQLDWTLVGYSLVCAVGTTMLFGLLPALRNTRREMGESLAQRSRTVTAATHRLQWLLVGVQVALAVTLLFGAGLLLRSFEALAQVSPGFDPSHVLTFRITGNWGETVDLKALRRRMDVTLDAIRSLPGVEAAATSLAAPGIPFEFQTELRVLEGDAHPDRKILATSRVVSAGYNATVRIPVLAGKPCEPEPSLSTAVVNARFAALYFAGTPPIGLHVEVPSNPFLGTTTIVGVLADAREQGLDREPVPIVYWCNSAPTPMPLFLVRTHGEPAALADTVRRRIHDIDSTRSVYEMMPLQERLSDTFAENRLRTALLSSFAATAVLLAAVGLYGTLSYVVAMRRREIGVRLAMGAFGRDILSSFLGQGLKVSLAGCVAGLAVAVAAGRALSGMIYGVSELDLPTFAGVVVLVIVTGALSSIWPAIRAARIEPTQVLRED
jgi:putative ABC transport system permease protein